MRKYYEQNVEYVRMYNKIFNISEYKKYVIKVASRMLNECCRWEEEVGLSEVLAQLDSLQTMKIPKLYSTVISQSRF